MDLKIVTTLALLRYTNAAPAGVMNIDWPLWPLKDRVTIPGAGVANTFTTSLVGSYPVGCLRSSGMVRFSQNINGNSSTRSSRAALTSSTAMAFWGTTAANTGTFIGGEATVAISSGVNYFTSASDTFPILGTDSWGCCTDAATSMTPIFCAAMVHGNDGGTVNSYENQVWWAYAEQITLTGTTGTLPTVTTLSGTQYIITYHTDILMVALNQLADGTGVCQKVKTVVNSENVQTFKVGAMNGKDKCSHLI
jgi:hypothetical protein